MVDLEWKAKTVSSAKSPKLSNKLQVSIPPSFRAAEISAANAVVCSSYDNYLRLPELRKLWSSEEFPTWKNESVLKPTLQALEISFRFVSTFLSDPRPYTNRREWRRRLESLATSQIEIIANLCEDDEQDGATRGTAPIVDLRSSSGVLARDGSYAEVWKIPGETTVVSRTSEASLLPRLATWHKSERIAQKILYSIECEMHNCPYTLGLGEPNLASKPNLEYDLICKPSELHSLKKTPYEHIDNYENQTLYTTHQILESWIYVSQQLLKRITERIENKDFERAASDCYLIERIWKLLADIEDLHLLMDPDDFLRLKNRLSIKSSNEEGPFCFRSKGLVEIARHCKDLKHKVPYILGVEVDPMGGPRVQEAAMKTYSEKKMEKIHLLQALQSIESAMKRFFYAYKQLLVVVMGSLEASANRVVVSSDSCDPLSQIFLEPTYFPSLDAAKTFLGDFWNHEHGGARLG
ncbi:nematode resistance protein-like HSPRO2 [Juglans microcarpa x Juglans regia]|uniref:nematode resistance protein-like HSPRO2 n=1 Tax=Juglans microcarpa x Juglans regia TaxID=2249226 RepID=UPI001B7DC183|nr:nematode resistance protein-like HSPRO2 [Juglans microcarpa x Juglans regia]